MKTISKIALFTAFLFFACFSTNAQNTNNSSAGSQGFALFQANSNNECINIKFNLNDDCYAILYAINLQTGAKTMLVDGDISKGLHGVMFKTGKESAKFDCTLEAFDNNGNILHSSKINIQ